MLSKEQVLEAVKSGKTSSCLDRRDFSRLVNFFEPGQYPLFGYTLREGLDPATVQVCPWTEEEVKLQLGYDLDFGFEKALDKRGISSNLMYDVVKMWMWVLEDELQHMEDYKFYGLPLFKAVAKKYGFPDPTGDKEPDDPEFDG